MDGRSQGHLAGLWAVGGQQLPADGQASRNSYYRNCPECGWQLTGKFSTCPRCHADLRLQLCIYCGGMVPMAAERCPRCTAPLP